MIVLDTVTRKLQAVLAGAVATTQPVFAASYVDVGAPDIYDPGSSVGVTASAVDVDVVPAPAAGKKRQIKFLSFYNKDSAAVDITVKIDDGGADSELVRVTLAAKSSLIYTDGEGFRVITTAGAIL